MPNSHQSFDRCGWYSISLGDILRSNKKAEEIRAQPMAFLNPDVKVINLSS